MKARHTDDSFNSLIEDRLMYIYKKCKRNKCNEQDVMKNIFLLKGILSRMITVLLQIGLQQWQVMTKQEVVLILIYPCRLIPA